LAIEYPANVYKSERFGELFFYPIETVSRLRDLELLPKVPWVQGGGLSNRVLSASDEDKQFLMEMGLDEIKIKTVGQPSLDNLSKSFQNRASIRKKFIKNFQLDPSKKILVFAVPHMAEIHFMTWEKHLTILSNIFGQLEDMNLNVLISLHPRANVDRYPDLINSFGYSLVTSRLHEFLPIADVFMATYSSTVRWASACKIPSLILNYDLEYDFLAATPGTYLCSENCVTENLNKVLDPEFSGSKSNFFDGETTFGKYLDGQATYRTAMEIIDMATNHEASIG
jgi:hypothetical protein